MTTKSVEQVNVLGKSLEGGSMVTCCARSWPTC